MIKCKIELFLENIPDLSRIFIGDREYFKKYEHILQIREYLKEYFIITVH